MNNPKTGQAVKAHPELGGVKKALKENVTLVGDTSKSNTTP